MYKCQHNILSQITERKNLAPEKQLFQQISNVYELPTSRSSFKVGNLCVHVCLKRFGSRSYLCYSVLFKLCVYAIFGAFKNYDANINLIIQGELTACQCLLLFITLDETGNWRGCTTLVWISSSSAYMRKVYFWSIFLQKYKTMYFLYCIWIFPSTSYVFSACFIYNRVCFTPRMYFV